MSLQRIFLNRKKARRIAVGWRMVLILVNVLVSVALGLWLMQLEWDARLDHYPGGTPPQSCRDGDGCLFSTPLTLSIKTLLTALTVLVEIQLLELIVRRVLNKQMQMCDEQFLNERKKDKTVVWNKTYRAMHTTPAWTVFSIYYNASDFMAMLIFLPHPSIVIPTTAFDKQLTLLMLARLYWILEVTKQFYYVSWCELLEMAFRNVNMASGIKLVPKPKFTLGGMLRLILHLYPVRFNLGFILGGMLFFSYAIYLFERESNDEVWTYPGAGFSALVAMMCLYPADPFNIYMPATWAGKLIAIAASGWGLMLTALLIESVAAHMQLSRYELGLLEWVRAYDAHRDLQDACARLIQIAWRTHKLDRDFDTGRRGLSIREYNKEHARFDERFRRQVKKIHRLRRRQLGTADLDRSIFSTDAFGGLSGGGKGRASRHQPPAPSSSRPTGGVPPHRTGPAAGDRDLHSGSLVAPGSVGSLPGSPRTTHTWVLGNTPVNRSTLTITSPSPQQHGPPATTTPPQLNVTQAGQGQTTQTTQASYTREEVEDIARRVADSVKQDMMQSFHALLEKHRVDSASDTRMLLAECIIRDRLVPLNPPSSL